jgi:hypothetical protein
MAKKEKTTIKKIELEVKKIINFDIFKLVTARLEVKLKLNEVISHRH